MAAVNRAVDLVVPSVDLVGEQTRLRRERERCLRRGGYLGHRLRTRDLRAALLLNVLEQKVGLGSLVVLPGVRALEVTSLRLESIMTFRRTDRRWASRNLPPCLRGGVDCRHSRSGPEPASRSRYCDAGDGPGRITARRSTNREPCADSSEKRERAVPSQALRSVCGATRTTPVDHRQTP